MFCAIVLISCDSDYQSSGVRIKNMGKEIYEGYKTKDTDKIIPLLSEHLQNDSYMKKKIEKSFECIEGNIEEYEEIRGSVGGGKIRDGEEVLSVGGGAIMHIKTDLDKKYEISYKVYLIDKENEDNVGVTYISVRDDETKETVYKIGRND